MRFLLEGVQYNDEQLQENCTALFATSQSLFKQLKHSILLVCMAD